MEPMQHRLNFISGIVMLVVAGTLVFVVTQREEPAGETAGAPAPYGPASRKGSGRSFDRTPAVAGGGTRDRGTASGRGTAEERPSAAVRRPSQAPGSLRKDLRVEVDAANPRRHELEQRAKLVESHALRRLGVLTEQLDLTASQQARIFPVLVRGSQSYDPTMRILSGSHARSLPSEEGVPGNPPLDKPQEQALVQKELDPVQSDELIERSISDLLIWEEIIGGLAHQLDQAVPGEVAEEAPERGMTGLPGKEPPVEEVPAAENPAPTPESRGGRNLFDQLDSGP